MLQRQDSSTIEGGQGTSRIEGEALIIRVNKAVAAITTRLQNLALLDCAESKVINISLFEYLQFYKDLIDLFIFVNIWTILYKYLISLLQMLLKVKFNKQILRIILN